MESCWYVVKVMPGKERTLTEEFNRQITNGKIKNIERFLCPTEKEFVIQKNKKILREKVLYNGYLYFECKNKLDEDELKNFSSIPNIMGMMGDKRPIMLRFDDVKRILKDDLLDEHLESKKVKYISGEMVKIVDGPFKSFEGIISEFKGEKIIVQVKIFGRDTNVELTLLQIEKLF